jgi:sulfite exporter TauE/SafE
MNEYTLAILTGLSIGLMGSVHCIGMCGPLALALPMNTSKPSGAITRIGLYNLGRAVMYGVLGILVGMIGSTFNIWGMQRWLSIVAGALILVFVAFNFKPVLRVSRLQFIQTYIRQSLSTLLQRAKHPASFFLIGILNALLPCGLVYVALTGGLATAHPLHAGVLLFSFGMATMPAMALLMVFRNKIPWQWRTKLSKGIPYLVSVMAILLILRGMNLGIPYISPEMTMDTLTMPSCHQAH